MAIQRREKQELYADFHMNLVQNPVSEDLARKLNEDAVKESIRNLLLTDRGERLFQPQLGSDIRALLFENIGPDTIILLKDKITETIEVHEPRANLISVDVYASHDTNVLDARIVFSVINSTTPTALTVTLDRIR